MNDNTITGTELKYKVIITATGFSMDDDNWSVTISRGSTSQTFVRADFGPGDYYAT